MPDLNLDDIAFSDPVSYEDYAARCGDNVVSNPYVAGQLPPGMCATLYPHGFDDAFFIKAEFVKLLGPPAPDLKASFNMESNPSQTLNNNLSLNPKTFGGL